MSFLLLPPSTTTYKPKTFGNLLEVKNEVGTLNVLFYFIFHNIYNVI
jgi:hypothetical protein